MAALNGGHFQRRCFRGEEEALEPVLSAMTMAKHGRWYRRRIVLPLLILLPPVGLVLLWKSKRFEIAGKIVLSILTAMAPLPMFFTFLWMIGSGGLSAGEAAV